MTTTMTTWTETLGKALALIAKDAEDAGVFARVRVADGRVECEAKDAAAPAFYRVDVQQASGKPFVCVSLVTTDRWLSQSIEQDLVHTGDKLADLIDEELAELGHPPVPKGSIKVEHYRSDDKLYTFRTPMMPPSDAVTPASARSIGLYLLAYEAAFRELGDMPGGDEE
jgi:hypothetical protein